MLAYLTLSLLVAIAAAQGPDPTPCRCGAFVSTDMGEEILYDLPLIEDHNCDQSHFCQESCFKEFDTLSDGGDLNFISSDGVTPIGQVLCSASSGPIDNKFIYAYSNLCDTTWEFTGENTLQPLCCDDGLNYFECPAL